MSENPCRVVVVDDSEDLRFLVRMALDQHASFTVVAEAGDGAAGVAAVVEHEPDVVLLDIAMPVMDGIQALSLIREKLPDTKVVMLSAFGMTGEVARLALSLGAHGYIEKADLVSRLPRQLRDIVRS